MRKLVQINVASNKGSTGKIAENIGLTAMTAGWETFMVHSARYEGRTKLNDISRSNLFVEYYHYVISFLFDAHGRASNMSTKSVLRQIRRIKPDIVHLHNIHGYYLNYKLLFSELKKLNIPVVWTLHDCWSFTGHCVYFDRVGCEKWKTKCQECPQPDSYPRALFDFSKRNFNAKISCYTELKHLTLVPVSQWLSGLVDKSILSRYPQRVIYNGIDLDVFKPVESNLRFDLHLLNKKIVLGVADGFGVRKGLNDFIRLSELFDDNYQIILIGVTEFDKTKIPDNIISICRTSDQAELAKYYSMADVYVNPTYEDNFPTTNIEALACGTPIITYNTGGSPEAVDEYTGIVVNRGDIPALYKSVINLCQMDRSTLRLDCRNRAINHYDKDLRFQEYLELYNELLVKEL